MEADFESLKEKARHYQEVLKNTLTYRKIWKESLAQEIEKFLKKAVDKAGIPGKVEKRGNMENLEAVLLSLGTVESGMYEVVGEEVQRHLIKQNGALIYQQMFNGKIMVMVHYPYIETLGQPSKPRMLGIYRPKELGEQSYLSHLEKFMQDIVQWEDYDDDEPNQRIGYRLNFTPGPEEEVADIAAKLEEEAD